MERKTIKFENNTEIYKRLKELSDYELSVITIELSEKDVILNYDIINDYFEVLC